MPTPSRRKRTDKDKPVDEGDKNDAGGKKKRGRKKKDDDDAEAKRKKAEEDLEREKALALKRKMERDERASRRDQMGEGGPQSDGDRMSVEDGDGDGGNDSMDVDAAPPVPALKVKFRRVSGASDFAALVQEMKQRSMPTVVRQAFSWGANPEALVLAEPVYVRLFNCWLGDSRLTSALAHFFDVGKGDGHQGRLGCWKGSSTDLPCELLLYNTLFITNANRVV